MCASWLFGLTIFCIGKDDILLLNKIRRHWLDSTVVTTHSQSGRSEQSAGLHQSTLTNCSSLLTMGCNGTQLPGVEAQQKVNMQNYTPSHYTHQHTSSCVTTYQNNFNPQSTVRNPYLKTRVFGTHPMIWNPYLKTPRNNACPPPKLWVFPNQKSYSMEAHGA